MKDWFMQLAAPVQGLPTLMVVPLADEVGVRLPLRLRWASQRARAWIRDRLNRPGRLRRDV